MLVGFGALATGVAARRQDGVVVDLSGLGEAYRRTSLDAVLALGPVEWGRMRAAVASAPEADAGLVPLVPIRPGDYVDFFACEHHVTAMGRRFRPGRPPLPPAWRHVPLGYHGRASTVVASGEPVYRPDGLLGAGAPGAGPGEAATWGPTRQLDVEVELGFVVGLGTERGRPVSAPDAWDRIFGAVVLNDWSARDIQAVESTPLGPHLGKSFCTTISPWVVPLDLLPRVALAGTGVDLAPLLRDDHHLGGLDLEMVLSIDDEVVSRTNARHLSWSPAQMYAALTSNGARVRPGDLFGSGTISGPPEGPAAGLGTAGSLLELGAAFLADGQTAAVTSPPLGRASGIVEGRRRSRPDHEREAQPCPAT
jgi:fumarylacetoacetase